MVRSHLNVISSPVKIGKTRLIGEFVGRIWRGEPFPDEETVTFPEKTTTLWVCGDRHQDELKTLLLDYRIPLEAVHLCARPENPYGNCILEENDTIKLMAHYAENEKPAFICIDTIWRATNKSMRLEEDVNALFDPIIEIAQRTGCTILCVSHLSKDGDTLGRRLEGAARSVTKLFYPDPDGQKDRRRLTTKGNFKQPDDLGLTLRDDGVSFDHDPPKEPEPIWKGGKAPSELFRACKFLSDSLRDGEKESTEVIAAWEKRGGSRTTLDRARKEMEEEGLVRTVPRPGRSSLWTVVEPTEPADNQDQLVGLLEP
jgi:hypothetical protein